MVQFNPIRRKHNRNSVFLLDVATVRSVSRSVVCQSMTLFFFAKSDVFFQGEIIFQSLLKAGTDRKISIKIAQNAPTQNNPNVDTEVLVKRKAAQVRSLNFAKLMGGGVLHTKFWIIDRKHVYVGSANMDWRSLTQVSKSMGSEGCIYGGGVEL